jgi:hypothetical protein
VRRAKAGELGLSSLATAALIGWEWLQRETDIFATFDVSHYRPKERPDMVRVVDEKTKQVSWFPLFDDAGVPLYPELMAELDGIKRERIGGLMLCRIGASAVRGRHGRNRISQISRTWAARSKRSSAPLACATSYHLHRSGMAALRKLATPN